MDRGYKTFIFGIVLVVAILAVVFVIVDEKENDTSKDPIKPNEPEIDYSPVRAKVAKDMTELVGTAVTYSNNLWVQDATIWNLSSDNRIILAESIAESYTSSGKPFDSDQMMIDAGIFNLEIERFKESIDFTQNWLDNYTQKKLDEWNGNPIYSDKMTLKVGSYTFRQVSSSTNIDLQLLMMSWITDPAKNKLYIQADDFWVYGGSAVITSVSGQTFQLKSGYNDLSKMSGFKSGIYTLEVQRTYAGYMAYTLNDSPLLTPGLVASTDSDFILFRYSTVGYANPYVVTNDSIVGNGRDLNMYFVPSNAETSNVDLFPLLDGLYPVVNGIMSDLFKSRLAASSKYYG